jgi:hypothetical protein
MPGQDKPKMIDQKAPSCATCRFYCQTIDPENRLYFDENSGECRRHPPHGSFVWHKTRPQHWCGEWRPQAERVRSWERIATHAKDDKPVLLYKKGAFCKQSGMLVGYWNARFNKWHDDGDRLFEHDEFSHWIALPEPPEL